MTTEAMSPETAHAFREMVVAVLMEHGDRTREQAEQDIQSGAVSIHLAPDSEEYYGRWNAWYDTFSPLEEEAYHHDPCGEDECLRCALHAVLVQSEPMPGGGIRGERSGEGDALHSDAKK